MKHTIKTRQKMSISAKKMWQRKSYRDKAKVWQSKRAGFADHKKQGYSLHKTWLNPNKNSNLFNGIKKRSLDKNACANQAISLRKFYKRLTKEERSKHLKHWIQAGQDASGKKTKNTSIEIALQVALKEDGLKFKLHPTMFGVPDIYFPKQKLCVFCDGEYWHRQPKRIIRDQQVSTSLKKAGFKVLRLKGQTILKYPKYCIARVRQML